jgi:hypothetical protein
MKQVYSNGHKKIKINVRTATVKLAVSKDKPPHERNDQPLRNRFMIMTQKIGVQNYFNCYVIHRLI